MNMDTLTKRYHTTLAILIGIGVLVLLIGCSDFDAATSPTQAGQTSKYSPSVKASEDFQYPPLSELTPPAGFRFLESGSSSRLDDGDCDSIAQQQQCREDQIRTINCQGIVSVFIPRNANPSNTTIRVIMPSECEMAVDCYPHPYQFDLPVQIIWNIQQLNLPADFNYDDLIPWYVNDAGELIPVNYRWVGDHQQLIVDTDHFSRYIVGQRIAG
jgi:hypothetical protein